ncbi:hypothetical protein EON83_12950 [bacterium]|nr:MAG: hypothetical protein EON83_12950 [bacterium]
MLSLVLLGVLVCFLNWQRLQTQQSNELTTSVALLVTGFIGILCSKGHTFTPVVAWVVVAGLLSWKEKLTSFAQGLSAVELRSAILLAILSFVIRSWIKTDQHRVARTQRRACSTKFKPW